MWTTRSPFDLEQDDRIYQLYTYLYAIDTTALRENENYRRQNEYNFNG